MLRINGIRGWYFTPDEIKNAIQTNQMLTMDFEFGAACSLACEYCYRTDDSRDETGRLLNFEEWKHVIDTAKSLGVKSIKLIGGGEITEEKQFIQAMEYIANKDIIVVLFTAGTTLGDDDLCKRIHYINCRSLAQWMYDLGMSVFIKVDSLNSDLQDQIAGKKEYSKIRDRALELLLEMGFNKHNPTRLGLEVNVSSRNYHEIMEIYSLRVKHNIYEDVVISMPCEVYFRNPDYDITLEQKKELYTKIYNFNKEHGLEFGEISPFIGGLTCNQLANGLYVNNRGQVFHCPGSFELLGDVREVSLSEIWKKFNGKKQYEDGYFCPFRERTNILPEEFVHEMRTKILIPKEYAPINS